MIESFYFEDDFGGAFIGSKFMLNPDTNFDELIQDDVKMLKP